MSTSIDMQRPVPRLALSRAEVAIAIGVCGNTVDQMVEEGFLPQPRRFHRRKVWLVADIAAAMQAWPEDETGRKATVTEGDGGGHVDEWRATP